MASTSTAAAPANETAAQQLSPFPNTWGLSLKHWWSANAASGVQSQSALLRRGLQGTGIALVDYDEAVPSVSEGKKVARLRKVALAPGDQAKDRYINCLEVGTPARSATENVFIVLHGYGGAFAFYWQNLAAFAAFPNTRLYFCDMLGMGLSGRPRFPNIKTLQPKKDDSPAREQELVKERVEEAENFFLESFDQFLEAEKINKKVTLVGHSLGGYLSTAYAIKNPSKVNKLILISPVGIPKSPYESEEEEKKVAQEKAQEGEGFGREYREGQESTASTGPAKVEKRGPPRTPIPRSWWTHLWEANISPFSVVRLSTFVGPKLVSSYAARRFALFEPEVQTDLFNYLYHIYGLKGSGEYCLAHILSPGAYARWPLINRFKDLSGDIPVSFSYGENDWMDKKGGIKVVEMLRQREDASEFMKKRSKVSINAHAGHWTFLDNPQGMNEIITQEMKETLKDHPHT